MSDGSMLRGNFAFKRVEKNTSSGGDLLAYFFRLSPKDHDRAHAMLGSNCTARLYYSPSGEVIVSIRFWRPPVRKEGNVPPGRNCLKKRIRIWS